MQCLRLIAAAYALVFEPEVRDGITQKLSTMPGETPLRSKPVTLAAKLQHFLKEPDFTGT